MAKYDNKQVRGIEHLPLKIRDVFKVRNPHKIKVPYAPICFNYLGLWCKVIGEEEFEGDSWRVLRYIGKEEKEKRTRERAAGKERE